MSSAVDRFQCNLGDMPILPNGTQKRITVTVMVDPSLADGTILENDAFVGSPVIQVTRMTEEGDVVVAEGRVRAARRDGGPLHAVFCDVFVMREARIRHLTSYLMEVKA